MSHAAFDPQRMNELTEELGPEDLAEIVEMFLVEAIAAVARLRACASDEDYGKALHFLRSGALNLGLAGLAGEVARITLVPVDERERAAASLDRMIAGSRVAVRREFGHTGQSARAAPR